MAKRVLIFHNAAAGRPVSGRRIRELRARLESLGARCDLQEVEPGSRRRVMPRLDGHDLLVICGGDGTLHTILPALIGQTVKLGVVPFGTGNVLAREVGMPGKPSEVASVLMQGRSRRICLGDSQGRPFHLMVGVGPDSFLISQVSAASKRFLGTAAFWLAGLLRFWSYPLRRFEVVLPDETLPATFAVVSNSRFYGGGLLVTPRASIFENSLDLCIFNSESHLRFVRYLLGTFRGTHLGLEDVQYRKTGSVEILGDPEIGIQMDGEPAGVLPRRFRLSPHQLDLVVPADLANDGSVDQ